MTHWIAGPTPYPVFEWAGFQVVVHPDLADRIGLVSGGEVRAAVMNVGEPHHWWEGEALAAEASA